MQPIQLDFKPSVLLSAIIVLMTLGACSILILLDFYWQIKLLTVILVVVSASYSLCRVSLLLLPWSCVALSINAKNQMQLRLRSGDQLQVAVQKNSVVTPYLTVLNIKITNDDEFKKLPFIARILLLIHRKVYSVAILSDSLEAESYRQLRVWLRWSKQS
jgi:toxin CptA